MLRRNRYRFRCRMGNCFSWLTPRSSRFTPNAGNRYRYDNTIITSESKSEALLVRNVDFQIENNSWDHKTDKFALTKKTANARLIVRRGSPFEIKLIFHRIYNQKDDIINLVFSVKDAENPNYNKKTQITIPVIDDRNSSNVSIVYEDSWNARVIKAKDNVVTVEITSSPDAIIGEYKINVDTKSLSKGNRSLQSNSIKESIFILFNPWNKRDSVYMRERDAKEEYVLNESGIIWRGTHEKMKPTPWNFAQHDDLVLEACLYALSKIGRLNVSDRGDPVKVVRHISSIVNSVDDNGIMVGNWKDDFSGGTAPTDWHGSLAILQQFYRTKKPVKFGQCWIFSGLSTTIARCIGIPSRVITNYQSAHDTHSSITVDRFFDEEGEPIKDYNTDSIWNFHSWNEVWITRPDLSLSGAYDGWNVIDATPQEASDGLYRCGPTSVEAVKQGEVNKHYDGKFVYAEVNADEVYWLHKGPKQPVKLISHSTDSIGLNISTKAILRNTRVDITDNYKHTERGLEERETMIKALRMSKSQYSRYYLNERFEDIKFEFLLLDDVLIGSAFTVRLRMNNKSNKVYTINSIIGVRTSLYTGITKSVVKKERIDVRVGPKSDEEIKVLVTYDEYERHLADQSIFNITVMATVVETDFQYYAMDDFRLRMPDIIVKTEGDIIQGRQFTCHVYFMNPLPKSLTKGIFTIEGPDYTNRISLPLKRPVDPKGEARASFVITPKVSGDRTISAKFSSRELNDVDGYKNIRVSASFPSIANNNNTIDDRY